jgi:hypothetical protein
MPQNCEKQAKSGFQHRHLTLVGRKSGARKMNNDDICTINESANSQNPEFRDLQKKK